MGGLAATVDNRLALRDVVSAMEQYADGRSSIEGPDGNRVSDRRH